jgi:peptide-N4-(N-acetyl-beta-glucosaminyl)asparagine amidase
MTIRFDVVHDNSVRKFNLDANETLANLFGVCARGFSISSPPSDYCFWYGRPFPIGNAPLASFEIPSHGSAVVLIRNDACPVIDEFALSTLPSLVIGVTLLSDVSRSVIHQIHHDHSMAVAHADEDLQAVCTSYLPFERLDGLDVDDKVVAITAWFQQEFFKFIKEDERPCRLCAATGLVALGHSKPSITERSYKADYAECYRCNECGAITRFPRYNAVQKLLETRVGRCGEFVNAFAAFLTTIGCDVRLVCNYADHVWVEYWSERQQAYVHVDPCENKIDQPLLYEQGWGRRLFLVIAVGLNQVADVTKKYVMNYANVVPLRTENFEEEWLSKYIRFQGDVFAAGLSANDKAEIGRRQQLDRVKMEAPRGVNRPEEREDRISGRR